MTTEELKVVITADVQDAINKVKAVKQQVSDLGNTSGTAKVKTAVAGSTEEIKKLRDALSKIPGVGGTVASTFTKIAAAVVVVKTSLGWAKLAISEFLGAFDFKNFDLGGDGIKGLIDTMKVSFKEAGASMAQAFGKGKAAAKGAAAASGEAGAAASGAGAAAGGAAAGFAALAAAVATVVAVVAAFVAGCRTAIKAAERLSATFFEARKVGLSTKAYQEWNYILGQVGVEADKLSDFIKSLSAAQNDLRDGTEAMVEAFEALGLSAEEASNMTQEDLFIETIKRLQQMEDGIQRTSIAYRIFGEDDAAQVANLLALNNEEMERMINNFYLLGGSASDSAVQKSLKLNSALSNLRLAWQGLSNTIGEVFMPIITAVVNALTKAIAVVNMFIRALFGFSIVSKGSDSVKKATAGVGGYSDSLKDATKAAKELKRTTMGFDELNIVNNPNKGGSSGSDMSGGGGGGGSFEIPDISGMTEDLGLDKMAAWFEKWKGVIQMAVPIALTAIGLIGGIACLFTGNFVAAIPLLALAGVGIAIGAGNGAWKKLGDGIVKVWNNVKKKAVQIWNSIAKWWKKTWNDIKKAATNIWNSIAKFFTNTWNGIKKTASTIWNAIEKFFKGIWDGIKKTATTVWNAITKFLKDCWNGLKSTVTTVFNAIEKFFKDCWNGIKNTATTVWNAITKFFKDTWNGLKTTATTIWNAVSKFFTDTWNSIKSAATTAWNGIKSMLETAWNAIKTGASALCENLKNFFSGAWELIKNVWSVVKGFFQDIWDGIKNGASALTDNVKTFFANAWAGIKAVWDVVKGYFQGIWDDIKNKASAALENVKGFFSNAWTGIKNTWSGVTGWFGDIWTGIKGKFSNVGTWFGDTFGGAVTKIKNKWSDIKDWFAQKWAGIKGVFTSAGSAISDGITGALKSTFNNFMSGAVGLINKFIKAINGAIDLINKIPGVNIGKLSTLKVPQLATGGIVTADTLARIGEGGKKEAVLPLEQNTGWMDMLADRLAERIGGGGQKIVLQVGERELGYATINAINGITKQTGGLKLHIV